MKEYILRENVLTDNVLLIPETGLIFKGGFIAIIKEFTFLNEWSDKLSVIRFKSKKRLFSYLQKNYPEIMYKIDITF